MVLAGSLDYCHFLDSPIVMNVRSVIEVIVLDNRNEFTVPDYLMNGHFFFVNIQLCETVDFHLLVIHVIT